jgi:hypothetical protein
MIIFFQHLNWRYFSLDVPDFGKNSDLFEGFLAPPVCTSDNSTVQMSVERWCNNTDGGTRSTQRKTCSHTTSPTINPVWIDLHRTRVTKEMKNKINLTYNCNYNLYVPCPRIKEYCLLIWQANKCAFRNMFIHIILFFTNMFRSLLWTSSGCFITRIQLIYNNSAKCMIKVANVTLNSLWRISRS